jgi:hypothetical protein
LAKENGRLVGDCERRIGVERDEWRQETGRLNAKLDGASDLVVRQNESMQKQIDSLHLLVSALQSALTRESQG